MKLTGKVFLNATLKGAPLDEQEKCTRDAWKRDPKLEVVLAIDMPDVISTPCCASFIVSRQRILMRPKGTYEQLRQWLVNTDMDNYYSSRVMEYTWHILFGDPPTARALKELSSGFCNMSSKSTNSRN